MKSHLSVMYHAVAQEIAGRTSAILSTTWSPLNRVNEPVFACEPSLQASSRMYFCSSSP